MNEIKDKVLERFRQIIDTNINEELDLDVGLKELGLDSISFIRFIVDLEQYFSIVFDDEMLEKDNLKNLGEIIKYIEHQI